MVPRGSMILMIKTLCTKLHLWKLYNDNQTLTELHAACFQLCHTVSNEQREECFVLVKMVSRNVKATNLVYIGFKEPKTVII